MLELGLTHTDQTLFIVKECLERVGLNIEQVQAFITDAQNHGIYFRERDTRFPESDIPYFTEIENFKTLSPADKEDLREGVCSWNEYRLGRCYHLSNRFACEQAVNDGMSIPKAVISILTRRTL